MPVARSIAASRLALLAAAIASPVVTPVLAPALAVADEPVASASRDEERAGPVLAPAWPRGTPDELREADPAAPVTSLTQALARSYWSSPALLAERARLRSVDFRMAQARSQFGPRIDYQASYGYQRDNIELLPGTYRARAGWSSTAAAILTQPVYSFGRNAAGVRSATADIAFRRAALHAAEQDVLFGAIAAYAGVIRDRNGIAIARDNLDLLERELSDNEARLAVRETTATDVEQVRTRVEQARARLFDTQRAAASSEAQFLAAVGSPAGDLEPPNPLAIPLRSLDEANSLAERNSPVIAAAHSREKLSRSQLDLARAELMPRIDLRGRAEVGAVTPYSNRLRQTELRGEVTVTGPLFASGFHLARIAEARASNDADWRLIDQALRENRLEVADAWNQWLALDASLDHLAKSIDAARAAYDGALLQERAGFRTTLDVIDLARELLSARTGYNAATASAYLARARLLAAMGMLEQSYLLPDAPAHDPAEHYRRVRYNGEFLPVTPLLRALDSATLGGNKDRARRDPGSAVTVPGVDLPLPDDKAATPSGPTAD